jgi:hypothetical protein
MDHFEGLSVGGRIMLQWILIGEGLDSPGLRYGQVVGPCEEGNEPLVSIKGRDVIE